LMSEMRNSDESYKAYKEERELARRSATAGFSESLHFVFSDKETLKAYGLEVTAESQELLNPITADLNTLRTSLIPNLLDGVKLNTNKSKSKIGLFEIGETFNSKREQFRSFALIQSGDKEDETVLNHGKPEKVDFGSFVKKVSSVIGNFDIEKIENPIGLFHPGQCGAIIQNGERIGTLGKIHPKILKENSLSDTFACEIDLGSKGFKKYEAVPHSIFQPVKKDLSVLISKDVSFASIKKEIVALEIPELTRVYPVDIYEDESLGDKISLSIRYILQSKEGTLEESQISGSMDKILEVLKTKFGAELR
ncbi:MAG: phenylalanine--tRNA ligase subunit beta, partial [Campylobacterales bacterium]|nr:phenylalanine--tRNA ligase subunit beta [Campylobacterales bacterium]